MHHSTVHAFCYSKPFQEAYFLKQPRFCRLLDLDSATVQLVTHVASQISKLNLPAHPKPSSIAAATLYVVLQYITHSFSCSYIVCNLEEVKKTQAEISKATSITEVYQLSCLLAIHTHTFL